jgi:hypothetical protein
MQRPTLALCIPAYNAGEYLSRLLQSAHEQTVPFDEIWVYDDCSKDDTASVAKRWGAQVVQGATNQGCSVGKNTLAQHTTCDWIHFHDADDALYPNFVECAHKWMQLGNPPEVVLFDYEMRSHDTGDVLGYRHFNNAALQQDAIACTIREQINPFCGLYHRQSFLNAGGYDTDPVVLYNEDVALHCRLAIAGLRFASDPTVTIINYCRSNSMSSASQLKCIQAQFQVMKKVATQVQREHFHQVGQRLWAIAAVAAAYLDWQTSDRCVELARQLHCPAPTQTNHLFRLLCTLNPHFAVRLRESCIRLLKPQLRGSYPTNYHYRHL